MIKIAATLFFVVISFGVHAADRLETVWNHPPTDARLRAYWWWINGNVTSNAITRDLEEMKAKGFGGAIITDANGADQEGNDKVPHGPTFFSPEWRALFKHTLHEADRLGLEMSLNIQSGWNLGGPMVKAEDAPKKLTWTETRVSGATNLTLKLESPTSRDNFYRDLFVLAYRVKSETSTARPPIKNREQKALLRALVPFSAPKSDALFDEFPATLGEEDTRVADVLDLTAKFDAATGKLNWQVPAGDWQIFRFGYTLNDACHVSTSSDGWQGYAIDPFDAGAFTRYWNAVVEPLIADAGPLAGKALKYLHTDSWEVEVANWTPTYRAEFLKRRGYDVLPWLPVIAGRIVNSRDESDRFLADFRKTMGDLAIDNHYKLFRDGAHKHGLLIHPESGGPHAVPIDAQRCLGWDDAPMSEFWAWSWTHRIGDDNRFFIKQPASAAHTYGHKLVLGEGFTTIGPHWQETLWDNLKPAFDKALCEGLNLLVWHAFVCSPESEGVPGQQYFAGTHLNPNVTWWSRSAPFFSYINRCQSLLQQGKFVADVAYYYGDHVPNFAQHKLTDPAHVGPGYDYDVITEEAILTRASVRDGKITLPDGMSYRVLVLPERTVISLPVLRKLKELVEAGGTVIGPQPKESASLQNYPQCDGEVARLAQELWSGQTGKGRVISGKTAREVLLADGVKPDCELERRSPNRPDAANGSQLAGPAAGAPAQMDFIHRIADGAEIYFVANRSTNTELIHATFRVAGKAPELWDAVSGEKRFAAAYNETDGRTTLPLELPPCGSLFVIFRTPAAAHPSIAAGNETKFSPQQELTGAWSVKFDPRWGGPESAQFDSLVSWTERREPGIKFYSGTATYAKTFDWNSKSETRNSKLFLDLGSVRELAEVRVNGKSCGIVWSPPFRVDITDAVTPGVNTLEVDVVNFWPNRIIGDAGLPKAERRTRTNIRKLTARTPLMQSGLLGPVWLLEAR